MCMRESTPSKNTNSHMNFKEGPKRTKVTILVLTFFKIIGCLASLYVAKKAVIGYIQLLYIYGYCHFIHIL